MFSKGIQDKTQSVSMISNTKGTVPFVKGGPISSPDGGDCFHQHESYVHSHEKEHTHERMENPGFYSIRAQPLQRSDFKKRAFTVGIGGPVGSGKTALVLALCEILRDKLSLGVVTNDIFTREDWEFLVKHKAIDEDRMEAACGQVETGGCPHAAIREDISINLDAVCRLTKRHHPQIVFVESGGDNLAANFSRELADYIIYIIDVAGGDKIPRKGGPGITQSDLFVINKTDLAEAVGASLEVMAEESRRMRQGGPTLFTEVKSRKGILDIAQHILNSYRLQTRDALAHVRSI